MTTFHRPLAKTKKEKELTMLESMLGSPGEDLLGLVLDFAVKLRNGSISPMEAKHFLRGELSITKPARSWREEDGVIYFSVKSDGTEGETWIKRLEGNGFRVGDYAKEVLRSPDFKPTNGVTTEVAVLKGMLFEDNDRITKKIRAEADKRKLSKPNAELACLIRLKFTDKEIEAMGLWHIVAMHEPINDSVGGPSLLSVFRSGVGRWLSACSGGPDSRWLRDCGFAFAVSQYSAFRLE